MGHTHLEDVRQVLFMVQLTCLAALLSLDHLFRFQRLGWFWRINETFFFILVLLFFFFFFCFCPPVVEICQ